MTVNILKKGDLPKIKKTCAICGCEFEADFREVENDSKYDALRNNAVSRYIIDCPCCGVAIPLSQKDKETLKLDLLEE